MTAELQKRKKKRPKRLHERRKLIALVRNLGLNYSHA